MVFSRPSEQLAWVRYFINTNSNGVEIMLSDIFFRTNMSITQLLLNIKNSFDNDTYQSVLQQLQPMQELTEILRYRLSEQPIYGSSRIGVRNIERNALFANYLFEKKHQIAEPEDPTQPLLVTPQNQEGDFSTPLTPQPEYSLTLGNKQYELSNHLGNVQVTLSDKKLGQAPPESSSFTHYLADVRSAVDYYPFGMQMPGRSLSGGYRWGFNGKELDNEVKGVGNSLDFGARIYDSRLGRWLSLDPLQAKYPSLSAYCFVNNSPIKLKDIDGRDFEVQINHKTKSIIIRANVYTLKQDLFSAQRAANFWVSTNGTFFYETNVNNKKVVYSIKFQITIIPVEGDHDKRAELANSDPIGNQFSILPDNQVATYKKNVDGTLKYDNNGNLIIDQYLDGTCSNEPYFCKGSSNCSIACTADGNDKETGAHELGHAFGLGHWNLGIMLSGYKRQFDNVFINLNYVNALLKSAGVSNGRVIGGRDGGCEIEKEDGTSARVSNCEIGNNNGIGPTFDLNLEIRTGGCYEDK